MKSLDKYICTCIYITVCALAICATYFITDGFSCHQKEDNLTELTEKITKATLDSVIKTLEKDKKWITKDYGTDDIFPINPTNFYYYFDNTDDYFSYTNKNDTFVFWYHTDTNKNDTLVFLYPTDTNRSLTTKPTHLFYIYNNGKVQIFTTAKQQDDMVKENNRKKLLRYYRRL